jgi:hypothetical protein
MMVFWMLWNRSLWRFSRKTRDQVKALLAAPLKRKILITHTCLFSETKKTISNSATAAAKAGNRNASEAKTSNNLGMSSYSIFILK